MDDTCSAISVINEAGDPYRVDAAKITHLAVFVCKALGVDDLELAISLVEASEIQALNRQHRGKDRSTDVLSFPQIEFPTPLTIAAPRRERLAAAGPPEALGDVVISLTDAEKNAHDIGQGLDREVCFLLIHGILHLCGHDHEEPQAEALMLTQQRRFMELLAEPSPRWDAAVRHLPEMAR